MQSTARLKSGKQTEYVNILTLPLYDNTLPADAGAQITIGDLHANTIMLLFFLVKHGVITNLTVAQYKKLQAIYFASSSVDDVGRFDSNLKEFCLILDKLRFKNNGAVVRLIGDELADRGRNDYLTLKVLEKLKENKITVEILISNHSIEFITACEKKSEPFRSENLYSIHASSMFSVQNAIEKSQSVTREAIFKLYNETYKSMLKAISYTLNADQTEITLYSHAPIDLKAVQALATIFNVTYNDESAITLAQSIEAINVVFQTYVAENTLHTLCPKAVISAAYNDQNPDISSAPLVYMMWNRLYGGLDRSPQSKKGAYRICYVHGHDSHGCDGQNVVNLDGVLGKPEIVTGSYAILYSHDSALKAEALPEKTNSTQLPMNYSFHLLPPPVKKEDAVPPQEENIVAALQSSAKTL